jgi:hypothetical protein
VAQNSEVSPMNQFRPLCGCGNIRTSGRPLPSGAHPNVPSAERNRVKECQSFIALPRRSIHIGDSALTATRIQSPICTDVECLRCHKVVRFFCGTNFAYLGQLGEVQLPPSRVMIAALPPSLQPLLAAPAAPRVPQGRDPLLDDADFDLMFANDSVRVVGSFKQEVSLPSPESQFTPRSHYT